MRSWSRGRVLLHILDGFDFVVRREYADAARLLGKANVQDLKPRKRST